VAHESVLRLAGFSVRFYGSNVIYINRSGRRFTSETGWEGHEASRMFMIFMPDDPNYPQLPVYAVFDDVTRRKGPLCGLLPGANVTYKWSLDNSKEISRGWIKQGRTIGELAGKISVDGAALTNTITRYNEDCQAGRDTQFGRPLETLEPLEAAPYYAIEMWPGMGTTCGGPRRDKKARVLDNEGKPIPRLYVAGGLGTIWGFLTLSGGGLTDCFVFGRIAGQNAAGEEPWS
jgi:hypothetical protein